MKSKKSTKRKDVKQAIRNHRVEAGNLILITRLSLVVPTMMFLHLVTSFYDWFPSTIIERLLSAYGLVLFGSCLIMLYREYYAHPHLHAAQPFLIKSIVGFGIALSLQKLPSAVNDLSRYLLTFSAFLGSLVLWECATMWGGYGSHFFPGNPRTVAGFFDALRPSGTYTVAGFFSALRLPRASNGQDCIVNRWREYRYWLYLDSIGFIVFFAAWLLNRFYRNSMYDPMFKVAILSAGVLITLVNCERYRRLEFSNPLIKSST